MPLLVKLLDPNAKAPTVANEGEDLGFDVYALNDVELHPLCPTTVPTGISVMFTHTTKTYGLEVKDRSSMAAKNHIITSAGVIDAGYCGELKIVMTYMTPPTASLGLPWVRDSYVVKAGDKIAQILPREVLTSSVVVVDVLPESSRGEKGFGSSGK